MMVRLARVAHMVAGSTAARALITAGLLAIVLIPLDWPRIEQRLADGRPLYGAAAALAVVAALTLGMWRWGLLLRVAGLDVPVRELYRVYWLTSFVNAFLPTSIGGDIARPLLISRRGPNLARAATTVVLDRAMAVLALTAMAWIGVATIGRDALGGSWWALLGVTVAITGGTVMAVALTLGRGGRLRRLAPQRFMPVLRECRDVAAGALRSPRRLALMAVLSLAFQALVTLQIVFLASVLNLNLSFGLAAVALALVTLAMFVPITIGGFGIREGAYAAVLASAGIGYSDAVLISLLSVAVLFLATLPGAWELVRGGLAPVLHQDLPEDHA